MSTFPLVVAALVVSPLGGCGASPRPELCGQIPDDGCPVGRGGTCEDRTCAALYDCLEGEWALAEECDGFGGAGGAGGGGGGSGGDGGQGPCEAVELDHSAEATGCTPDLQNPDCPAVAAETCVESACLTGCIDFWMCTKSGWEDVAYCTEEGELFVTQLER